MALNFFQYTPSVDKYGPVGTPDVEVAKADEPGLLSNMGRTYGAGVLQGIGGMFDFVGAQGVAKQFYGWSDDANSSMSSEAQTDMAKPLYKFNEQDELELGEGFTDLDTWLLTLSNGVGQLTSTAVPGLGLASKASKAMKLSQAGDLAAKTVGSMAFGGSSGQGLSMEQARQEWLQMPDEIKAQSDLFKNTIREMKQKQPELDGEALWAAAEDNVAERLAADVRVDPELLLANFAGSAIAGPIIGRALMGARIAKSGALRSALKGFAIEGATEAVQGGVQEYSVNEALSQVDGRDPMDGVALAALTEGTVGGALGGVLGSTGGLINRGGKPAEPVRDKDADAIRQSNPTLAIGFDGIAQSLAKSQADLGNIINQPALEGELLGPEPAPSEPMMITDKNIIFAGDGRPQQAAQEYVDNLQRQANQAASVPRLPQKDIIFAGDESGVRVKGNGQVYPSPREAMTSKQARAMKRSGTPVEAVQFGDGWGWRVKEAQPEQQAEQVQQPEVQAAPEVQLAPVQMKKSGDPFKSEKEMKISASYKAAAATGAELETVPVDGGFGFRVKAPVITNSDQATENQRELERIDDENRIGKPKLKERIESGALPVIDYDTFGDGTTTYFAKGIGGIDNKWKVKLELTKAEVKLANQARADIELSDTPEEVADAKRRLSEALLPAAKRAINTDQAAVTPSPKTDTAPQAVQEVQARPAIRGKLARAFTPSKNMPTDIEYRIVEAESLITSNDFDGAINPNYPQELQPRDRDQDKYIAQVRAIAKNPDPLRLGQSRETDRGAPIVRDGIVESGNGRSIGLREAYRAGTAENYRASLADMAAELGIDPQQLNSFKQPVLVRERVNELTTAERLEFVQDSNRSAAMEQSPVEIAKADARIIDDSLIKLLSIPDSGDVLAAENDRFLRGFAAKLGSNAIGSYATTDGQWNKTFKDRVQNAIFAKGYDDTDLLTSISESTNPDSKNLLSALMNVSGKLGTIRALDAEVGSSLSGAFTQAASLFTRAKRAGSTVREIDSQTDFVTGHSDADIVALAEALEDATRSGKRMTAMLGDIVSTVLTALQSVGQTDIFTGEQGARPNVNEVIRNAAGKQKPTNAAGTAGLFDGAQNQESDTREQPGLSQDPEPSESESRTGEVNQEAEPTTQTPADAGVSVSGPVERIDDFGEKLGGARKDVWGGFSEAVSSELDTRDLPLSKSFPEPDYVKMAADGVSMETLAIIAAMRSEIPAKPRVSYKVRRWAEKVDVLRNFARDLIGGELTPAQVIAAMSKGGGELQAIADAIPAIAQANPETIKLAAKYRLGSGSFSMFRGKEYKPSKTFYFPKNGQSEMIDLASDNKQTALDNLVNLIKAEAAANQDTPGQKQSKISVYQNKLTKQVYLGWEGGKGVLKIQDFDSINDAREALKNNRDAIEAKLKALKSTPSERRMENRDRVGPARFAGNITPAIFADTFGFRGVEFGNWVEQSKRQKDLNEAYDALMDLADVLGIPPKALALNGELGMAFGARGKGAATTVKAKAHYEPSYVAINLTKESGAGSLAHEWWHAVDNYFSRLTGKPRNFATEGSQIRGGELRPQVRQAFTNLMQALRKTNVFERAAVLDSRRSKAYWSTEVESSARSFEAFIIAELEANGFSNDYLANIIDPEAWDAFEALKGNNDKTYPYPTKSEQQITNPAFRALFDTLETKETDKGTMLFSKQNTIKAKPSKGVNSRLAKQFVNGIMQRLNGAAGIKVVVLETQAEAEKLWQMSLSGDLVRGAYNRATNTAYVIAENIKSMDELREVVAHEVIGHGGLQNVISKADYKTFIERLKQTRNNRAFAQQWAQIDNDYEGFSENDKAEELFAYFVQNKPVTGPVKFWWNALKRWLHKALVSVSLAKAGDPDVDAMQDMLDSIRSGFMFNRGGEADSTGSELAFRKIQPSAGAFNRWFGGSKVVDENGDPLVVYHGTNADFSVFSDEKLGEATGAASAKMGFFFASNPNVASSYADTDSIYNKGLAGAINRWTNGWYEKANEKVVGLFGATARTDGGNVMPVYLAIKNPLVVDQAGKEYREQTYYDILVRAKNGGHDGVIIKNTYDEGFMDLGDELTDVYIAFNPTQIKSATGNNGDFDPSNPDIRFSKSKTAEAVAGAVNDFVGRKRLDPDDPYAVENRRLKEQDKTLWEKAKQVFMRNFAPGGMLPRSIFDAKITRDGELESGEMTIKHLIFALERAVQKDTGKNVDNQSDEFINMMADALAGKVNDKLGNETKAALVAMRQYIDALSGDYLSVIQAKIDELTERIKQDDKYTDKAQALNEIELYEKIKGNMGVYVNRSYRAFDDPKWFQKVPVDVINRAREYLRKQYKSQGDDQAEANRKAEVTLNKILKTDTAYDSMASFIAESKLGAKDLSTLIARKDISPEIRELLGEYKDPRMNFAKTATKMARLVWNSRFLDKVKADGVGVFFFDEDSRPAEATVQIAGDNSKAYEPLNGYWTFPEVAEALQDSLGTEKMEAWYEAAVKLTSMVKYGKTVLSPTTAMRNWQSAMFFAVANGHFDFKHMKKSLAAFREQVSQSATGDDLAYLKKLKKLGVVYDAPYAGEMMQLLSDSKIDEWLEGRKGKVFGTARQINNLAQGFYSFGDDFWKIIGFENEKANFISAGLSEAEAEKMAAERIRNTYPTYSMVGRAIKKLARFPLMGTFVSFPAEILRTTANMLRYASQDMKSDNPKIRAMARKRLTGMALVSGMFYALSAMTAAMLGVDDEEEEAIRDVGPSWQKNSTFLFYGRDDKGKLQYFDISFLDPYGYFKRPITALMRDQPWEDAAASGAADMLSPFFGADITAGTFFQVFANKKQSGGQVYNEYSDTTDQLADISGHILKGLSPGFINNGLGIFNAAMGNRREGSGKEYDLGDEMMALMGWRASSLDAPTALYYRSFDFADQLQAANSTLNKVLRSDNSVDDDDIADAKEEAQRQYDDAFKQMQRIVQSGRNAGMTKEQVYRTLKLSGVSSRNISGLVNGNIPPMQAATLQTQVKAVAKAREIRGDEQASEVLRRFQIARQLQ